MFAIVTSPLFSDELTKVVQDKESRLVYQKVDTEIDIVETLDEISGSNIDVLIVDMISIKNQRDLPFAVRKFRIENEDVQIIIIAPNCYPGNQEISMIVTMGVYDILTPKKDKAGKYNVKYEVIEAIDNPCSYSKAVKWDIGINSTGSISEDTTAPKVVTVIKDKIVGSAVVAVAGTMSRIGTTHISINIASFLKKYNPKIAVVEYNNSKVFDSIREAYEDVEYIENGFLLDGIYFYSICDELSLLDILQNDFKYVVLDMGIYEECNKEEFKRAEERIVVSGVKDWEIEPLEQILRQNEGIFKNKYVFNYSDEETFKEIELNMEGLKIYKAPLRGNPFEMGKVNFDFNKALLKDITPEHQKNSKSFSQSITKFLKRGKLHET